MKKLAFILSVSLLLLNCCKVKDKAELGDRDFKVLASQDLFDYTVGEDVGGTWSICQQPIGSSVTLDGATGIFDDDELICVTGDGQYCFEYIVECPTCPLLYDTTQVWFLKCCIEATCLVSTPITCDGGTDGAVTVNTVYGVPTVLYLWDDGGAQTTQTATGLGAGTYSVTVTDDDGCTDVCSIVLDDSYSAVQVSLIATPDLVICAGETIVLTPNITIGTPNYTYLWSTAETSTTIDVTASGLYTVTVTDDSACTGVASVTITDGDVATGVCQYEIDGGGFSDGCTIAICEGVGLTDVTMNGEGTAFSIPVGSTYLWSTGSNMSTITLVDVLPADDGDYFVTITTPDNCESVLTFDLTVTPKIDVTCTPTNTSCPELNDGQVVTTVNNGTGPFTYLWSNAEVTDDITGLSTDTYTVTVTDTSDGCTGTCSAVVEEGVSIIADITGDIEICDDETTNLTADSNTSDLPQTYAWSHSAEVTQVVNVSSAATYTVTVTDNIGCTDKHSVLVTVNTAPTPVCEYRINPAAWVDGCTIFVCEGDEYTTVVLSPYGTGYSIPIGATFSWSTGSINDRLILPDVTPADDGAYTLTVTTLDGCDTDIVFNLTVYPETILTIGCF